MPLICIYARLGLAGSSVHYKENIEKRKEKWEKWKQKTPDGTWALGLYVFFYTFAIYYFAVNTVQIQFIFKIPDWSISTMTKHISIWTSANVHAELSRFSKIEFCSFQMVPHWPHYAQTLTFMCKIHFFDHYKNQMSPRRDSDIRIWHVC